MSGDREREGLTEKVRDAAGKVEDALEPGESDGPGRPINDASDPFADAQRPDEEGFPHGSVAGID